MTIVIGYSTGKRTYMLGDLSYSSNTIIGELRTSKVFEKPFKIVDGKSTMGIHKMLIGNSGSIRTMQLLHHEVELEPYDVSYSPMKYLVTYVIPHMKHVFEESNATKLVENVTEIDGSMLVGFLGKLYTIQQDLAIIEPSTPYCCIGAGEEYARGAMEALEIVKDKLNMGKEAYTKLALRTGVQAAIKFNPFCQGIDKIHKA